MNPAGGRNPIWVSAATTNQNTVPISGTMGANGGKEKTWKNEDKTNLTFLTQKLKLVSEKL